MILFGGVDEGQPGDVVFDGAAVADSDAVGRVGDLFVTWVKTHKNAIGVGRLEPLLALKMGVGHAQLGEDGVLRVRELVLDQLEVFDGLVEALAFQGGFGGLEVLAGGPVSSSRTSVVA